MRFWAVLWMSSRMRAVTAAVAVLVAIMAPSAALFAEDGYALQQVGEACYVHADCAAGLICTRRVPVAADLPSSCQPLQMSGEACQTDTDCARGLVCNNAIAPTRTADVPFSSDGGSDGGSSCRPPQTSEGRCNEDNECANGLLCNISFGVGQYRCLPPLSEGGPCRRDAECRLDLVCNWALPASPFIPRSCRPPLAVGGACAGRQARAGFGRQGSSECQVGLACVRGQASENGYPNSCRKK